MSLPIKVVCENSHSRFKMNLTLSLTTLPTGFIQQTHGKFMHHCE